MTYRSTKTYGHEQGLSACFRQWRADSHCNTLHGYALGFSFVFEATHLDRNGWVIDFGGLKALKARLVKTFDHRTLIAIDDPLLEQMQALDRAGGCNLLVVDGIGCEYFARLAADMAIATLNEMGETGRVRLVSAECREHAGNSAIYLPGGST